MKAEDASPPSVGYTFPNSLTNEAFTTKPSDLTLSVNNASRVQYSYTDEGLDIGYNTTDGSLYIINKETGSNTVGFEIDPTAIDDKHMFQISVQFSSNDDPGRGYREIIDFSPYLIKLRPLYWMGPGSQPVEYYAMPYPVDAKDQMDIVVSVRDGDLVCSIDGLQYVHKTDYKPIKDLVVSNISLSSNSNFWDNPSHIHLKKLQIGQDTNVQYHDRLHKTITPWGKDFSVSMQLHADYSNPAQLKLMKELADTYGIKGEMEGWVNVSNSSKNYGISSSEDYRDALLALNSSGWDIGLHAVNDHDSNRTEMLADLAIFEQYFGPLKSWVDHGGVNQDLWQNGSNKASDYYIADYLVKNQALIWINEEEHSHSQYEDLNYEGAAYINPKYPGLDLFRTSRSGLLTLFSEWSPLSAPVNKSDFDVRLRSYADERAVLAWHDYTISFFYVHDGSTDYAFTNHSNMGYPYANMTTEELQKGANLHSSGTWNIKPPVGYLFESMRDTYDVWYATPRDIYQRSKLIQSVDLTESSSQVAVTNHNNQSVDGFTLFSKSKPNFYLQLGNSSYYSVKGAESWSFVIDSIPANSTSNFTKVLLPEDKAPGTDSPLIIVGVALLWVVVAAAIIYAFKTRRR